MARWSDSMRLADYADFRSELLVPGVYEIGYIRRETFYPKYIGKAEKTLFQRIKTYGADRGQKSHNSRIRELVGNEFFKLWFHVIKMDRLGSQPLREALLLMRHGRGDDWLYEWNRRYEMKPLIEAGYVITD